MARKRKYLAPSGQSAAARQEDKSWRDFFRWQDQQAREEERRFHLLKLGLKQCPRCGKWHKHPGEDNLCKPCEALWEETLVNILVKQKVEFLKKSGETGRAVKR